MVFAYGKAAAAMAAEVEAHWAGPLEGIAVTRHGHGVALRHIALIEAGHPHPDAASERAARAMLDRAEKLGSDDLALCLVSGGGSALLSLPHSGIGMEDKRRILEQLHRSGAPIGEINVVRRRLSAIKGGRLGAACAPARVHSIVISDIPGDDPALVASGPSFMSDDATGLAADILRRRGIVVSAAVDNLLAEATPEPLPHFEHRFSVAATARHALDAAAVEAASLDLEALVTWDAVEGEARDVGARDAVEARGLLSGRGSAPLLLLSGGETSVTVRGSGSGGRNAEYLAAFAQGIAGLPIAALAADTDGIDGTEDNAGAYADGTTVARADALGLDPAALLADNDAYRLFEQLGDLVMTGPTLTNVNDFRAILIGLAS